MNPWTRKQITKTFFLFFLIQLKYLPTASAQTSKTYTIRVNVHKNDPFKYLRQTFTRIKDSYFSGDLITKHLQFYRSSDADFVNFDDDSFDVDWYYSYGLGVSQSSITSQYPQGSLSAEKYTLYALTNLGVDLSPEWPLFGYFLEVILQKPFLSKISYSSELGRKDIDEEYHLLGFMPEIFAGMRFHVAKKKTLNVAGFYNTIQALGLSLGFSMEF